MLAADAAIVEGDTAVVPTDAGYGLQVQEHPSAQLVAENGHHRHTSCCVIGITTYAYYGNQLPVISQMEFSNYTGDPVRLAVEIVNSFGWESGTEKITDVEALVALLDAAAGVWREDLPSARPDDVDGVRRLRQALRAVFEAADAHAAADEINSLLERHHAVPSLSTHGAAPHMHFEPRTGSLTDWLGVITAMGLATVIADHGIDRLGICSAHGCRDAFVDTSRNLSRRHCSATCRNRENVAAHRRRQRTR